MINFTVGPVQGYSEILELGKEQVPYFRTNEFSKIMLENEALMCKFANAPNGSRAVFLTGSGTAAMEAVVMNCFSEKDKVLVINGGSFGNRFAQMCKVHNIPYTEIKLSPGEILTKDKLQSYKSKEYTALLVNIHETSTGVYYNPEILSEFCKENGLFFVVDAVSSFLADPFHMEKWGVDVMLTGSQKALAVPPGVSIVVMNNRAIQRIYAKECSCMYLDLKSALVNGERGQTPFTPAVGVLLQINARLHQIEKNGGYEKEQEKVAELANDFRKKVQDLPLKFFSSSMSNAVTALETRKEIDAHKVFEILKDEYHIWICPNGGDLAHRIFRVGHLGALTPKDNDLLINALRDLVKRRKL